MQNEITLSQLASEGVSMSHGTSHSVALFFLILAILLVVQKDETEDAESKHHGEGTDVVWVCRWDETLKLGVLIWAD